MDAQENRDSEDCSRQDRETRRSGAVLFALGMLPIMYTRCLDRGLLISTTALTPDPRSATPSTELYRR
ncbi:hypothetical protein [Nocardia abscessus]|uniref:hypothetical protein n=1 Tax=Nocardia abscessus TaxID=120957 RepID=UPI0024557C2A|nr:hypothetical protein [Nocardia abscessus]